MLWKSVHFLNNSKYLKINAKTLFRNTAFFTNRIYLSTTTTSLESNNLNVESNESGETEKSFFARQWDKFSLKANIERTVISERLFRSALNRANDKIWYTAGRIPYEFKFRHALITMHVWFLHKRLIRTNINRYSALLIQEELFDILWTDTKARIRAEKVMELSLGRHLKTMQSVSFVHCMHYDHAFTFDDERRRRDELHRAIWLHVFHSNDDYPDDLVDRLAMYVEFQYDNIMNQLPEKYWREGRIGWGPFPNFESIVGNNGKVLPPADKFNDKMDVVLEGWTSCLSNAGEVFYWKNGTDKVQWDKPKYF